MCLTEVVEMNWKRVFLFGVGLGITGALITTLGSLGGQAGLAAAGRALQGRVTAWW